MIGNLVNKHIENWFFIAALLFAVVLPFSHAMVSILAGVLLFTAIWEDSWKNKLARLNKNRVLFFIPGIFLIYLISSVLTVKPGEPWYDLQKTLFYLVIPLAFIIGKPFTDYQQRKLLFAFSFSVMLSIFTSLVRWLVLPDSAGFSMHEISLVSHIRFSFQLILGFWFLIFFFQLNCNNLLPKYRIVVLLSAVVFLLFLFFQQSLTGLIAFGASLLLYSVYHVFQLKLIKRYAFLIFVLLVIAVPVVYLVRTINNFYNIEKVSEEALDKTTIRGNPYLHDLDNPMVENGHYVFIYLCEDEMRNEWNNLSTLKYDSLAGNGYPVSASLIRYLTSKGLRKDADGVLALSEKDRRNIEMGMANVIFSRKEYSLYPRIYQTIWEYYMFSKTGDPNYQSFSQRIVFSHAAIEIIKENFWFGVGAGNWKEAFNQVFTKEYLSLKEDLYASSHNQYLNYMVKFGILGFLAIMFFIVYPVVISRKYVDHLFILFLVSLFFANFADSNFEAHMGSSFFLFFYSFFMKSGKTTYLKLS
ncbi:MAG: hypothetical protein CSA36_07085 [Draconibacterium sp.]|nr:MAG: hypothetical protein CSA36_07085 [Draconibacterium sp.]